MDQERIADFIDYFKENYSITQYKKGERLTEEDKLFLLGALSDLCGAENKTEYDYIEDIKAQNKYKDYFNITTKASNKDLNPILADAIEKFFDADVKKKSGIEYSDRKQALASEGELFNEETIQGLCAMKGFNEQDIKKLLASKLEEHIRNKMEYFKMAMQNMHSLYCYAVEKWL